MTTVRDWRSPRVAEDFAHLDYADFAQEFLRRNPEYCREYHELMARIAAGGVDAEAELAVLARRWGLSCPLYPRPPGRSSTGVVGAGIVRGDSHSGCCAY
ncbi:MAG: hypothetical protein JWR80_550 [Bradyrhizobium sp.]|nr:hypothetical protein [Bradyrhizobium sp.]